MRPIGTMLLLFTAALTLVAQKSAEHVKTYTPDAIHWGAAPNALPAGAELSVLEGNPMAPGAYTMRLKMPDGYKIPPHHHLRREHVTVISGAFKVGMGDSFDTEKMSEFAPGSFAYLEPTVPFGSRGTGLTLTTDNGTQFTSARYVETLNRLGITHRRTAYNHPEGNSYIERLHRSLKEEEVWLNEYQTFDQAERSIARWIEEYNHDRPHRGVGNRTPHEAFLSFATVLKNQALTV